MSHIEVISAAIEEMAGRLSGIAPGTSEFHGQVATHATAAANTEAHEAVSGLMARWATALPVTARRLAREWIAAMDVMRSAASLGVAATAPTPRRRDCRTTAI